MKNLISPSCACVKRSSQPHIPTTPALASCSTATRRYYAPSKPFLTQSGSLRPLAAKSCEAKTEPGGSVKHSGNHTFQIVSFRHSQKDWVIARLRSFLNELEFAVSIVS